MHLWMNLLLLSGLTVATAMACWRRDADRPLDLMQPGMLMAGFFYVYIIVPAWYMLLVSKQSLWIYSLQVQDQEFTFVLMCTAMSVGAFGLGYRLTLRKHGRFAGRQVTERFPVALVLVTALGVSAGMKWLRVSDSVAPITDMLLSLSPTERALSQTIAPAQGVWGFVESSFEWSLVILIATRIAAGRLGTLGILFWIGGLFISFLFTAKRSTVLPFIVVPMVVSHLLRRRISWQRATAGLVASLLLLAALLFARIILPHYVRATGGSVESSLAVESILRDPGTFFFESPELAALDLTMVTMRERERLLTQLDGPAASFVRYNFLTLAYFVPRALWVDKPQYRELGQEYYSIFISNFREDGSDRNVGFSVGIMAALYLFGGVSGLVLGMFVLGMSFRFWHDQSLHITTIRGALLHAILVLVTFQFLRFGTLGFTLLYFFQAQMTGVLLVLIVWRANVRQAATWVLTPRRPVAVAGTPVL